MEAKVNEQDQQHTRDARKNKPSIVIDMNPMVDLAFLLLTFFMLTTTFSKPQAMEFTMPVKPGPEEEQQEQPVKESKVVTLLLAADDNIYWYHGITEPKIQATDYSKQGIRNILLEKNQAIAEMVVLIKPTNQSDFENLVNILDEMNITKIERYAIVDITEMDKQLIASHESRE